MTQTMTVRVHFAFVVTRELIDRAQRDEWPQDL